MYYIICENEIVGKYESYHEANTARLKLEAKDFINDEYKKDKYSIYYY